MSERFYRDEPIHGDRATLADQEAHHLLHVMRLKAGARVTLFDGGGAEFDAEVTCCGRREVELAVLARHEIDRELPAPLVVAVAMPKGDRQRWLVEKLTELGATALVPIVTERSVAKLSDSNLAKLRRVVIEASKQCRRNRLMAITEPYDWRRLLEHEVAAQVAPPRGINCRVLAHPEPRAGAALQPSSGPPELASDVVGDTAVTLAIGPEGGFTDEEVAEACKHSFSVQPLGKSILRTETAAVAMTTLFAAAIRAARD